MNSTLESFLDAILASANCRPLSVSNTDLQNIEQGTMKRASSKFLYLLVSVFLIIAS